MNRNILNFVATMLFPVIGLASEGDAYAAPPSGKFWGACAALGSMPIERHHAGDEWTQALISDTTPGYGAAEAVSQQLTRFWEKEISLCMGQLRRVLPSASFAKLKMEQTKWDDELPRLLANVATEFEEEGSMREWQVKIGRARIFRDRGLELGCALEEQSVKLRRR